ncbi:MAG: phosphate ABC transporter permease PstA [Verrucomicrobiota bacterium]
MPVQDTQSGQAQARHPFYNSSSKAKRNETVVFWGFRIATYFVLLCAFSIFAVIFYKGGQVVFQSSFPFVNVPFLTESPQTLHVFEHEGESYELGDVDFRAFVDANDAKIGDVHVFEHEGQTYRLSSSELTAFQQERDVRVDRSEADDNPFRYEKIGYETYSYSGGGIWPCIVGTVLLVVGAMFIALTLGILSAIFLSEYARPGTVLNMIRLSILNLAGVPSIVFGIFGVGMFVVFLEWEVSLLAGWFTLAFMVLPIVISASEESLKAIPQGLREASLALGASKWTTIRTNVLPYAMPGILTSSIIGVARVAGETAPIMFTAAFAMRDQLPWEGLSRWYDIFFQGVMALPYHIYVVSSKIPSNEFTQRMQYGTAFVFLVIVAGIALTSILLRARMRKKYRW